MRATVIHAPHDVRVEELPDAIDPSPVFGLSVGLDGVPGGYKAMDERTALKVLITP